MEITGKVYKAALELLYRKNRKKRREAFPIITNVYENETTNLNVS
jgi:hypothetical protein